MSVPVGELEPSAAGARELDADDDLAALRREFELPREGRRHVNYLCGHSLGLMPRAAREAVNVELDRWARVAVDGHFADPRPARSQARHTGWLDFHERFAAPLAKLAGAKRDEVVAMNTLTVNLHLMLATFFRPTRQRYKIAIERGAFPSDRYAVQSQLHWHGLDRGASLIEIEPRGGSLALDVERFEELLRAEGERIAVVLLPGVQYLSGERLDIAAYTAAAHRAGCLIGFDLAHAIGNVPLGLHDADVDFAVWCSYKYLNSGPGAVGGCFVHSRHAATSDLPRLAGWWGHDRAQRFAAEVPFAPMRGAAGWQLSNPPIFSLAPLAASLDLFGTAGLRRLRRKSVRLVRFLELSLQHELGDRVRMLTPSNPERRGCQVSLQFSRGPRHPATFAARLRAARLVVDWRGEGILRLAPVPLYNRFIDVYEAVRTLRRELDA